MGRIRTVKPELFTHEDLFSLESETGLPVRLAFVGLFTVCDREGRFKWEPNRIKLAVLPYDQVDFSRVLDALRTRDMVRQYSVDGKLFGFIPTFLKHQVINNRETVSSLPEPLNINELERVDDASSTREAHVAHAPLGEGKGKEGKGTEREKEGVAPVALAEKVSAQSRSDMIDVEAVFNYWQTARGHERAKLDDKRKKAIKARLKDGYSIEDLRNAVDGISKSAYHMGQNDNRAVYDDIELICRTAANVDKFLKLAAPAQVTDPGLQHQIDVLNEWMAQE